MLSERLRLVIALLMPGLGAIADAGTPPAPAPCEAFGFDFYRALAESPGCRATEDANLAISPLSLASVLDVLRLGSKDEVEKELRSALHFTENPSTTAGKFGLPNDLGSKGITLSVGNSLWVDAHFEPKHEFLETVHAAFGDVVFRLDFAHSAQAASEINAWIAKETNGHIRDLLTAHDVPEATGMVVANAVWFKGEWSAPFNAKLTSDAPFHLLSGKENAVAMMHRHDKFGYAEVDGVKALELPYGTGAVSMLLFLPEPGPEAMAKLEASLRSEWLGKAVAVLTTKSVKVAIPRFTFSFEPADTVGILKKLGVRRMFTPSRDFSPISDKQPLYVGMFKHRAWLEVNEKGTEAAAATAAGMRLMAMPVQPLEFKADRPFLFVIRHKATGTPLFIGRVSNPVKP